MGLSRSQFGHNPGFYGITSSALNSNDCGMVSPRALAVLRLITSSNFVGCSTGRSPSFAPLRILSTYVAARRPLPARCPVGSCCHRAVAPSGGRPDPRLPRRGWAARVGRQRFRRSVPAPYTSDLVRLATSTLLAIKSDRLTIARGDACEAILSGYEKGLAPVAD